MKVDLTKQDQAQINRALDSNPVRRWLLQKENLKFEIGDVLLKYTKRRDYATQTDSWVAENINSDNKLAQRYVYVFEDEHGIGYLKQLRVSNGTLGKELYCITDFDLSYTKFEVDPEYAEHVLLDADFDIKSIHKKSLEARKLVSKMNRKIGQRPRTMQEFTDIFDKLKKGDTFWTSQDYTGRYIQEYKLTDIVKVSILKMDADNDWEWRRFKEKNKGMINSTYLYKITYTGTYSQKDRNIIELNGSVIYLKQKPAQEEKK